MHHWNGGWGAGNWLVMGFGMLVFWAFVVVLVLWAVRSSSSRAAPIERTGLPPRLTALAMLDERYARGESGDEEYRTRRATLTGT